MLTLGLGIGATTAVYSVSDALLWKPVPLPRMETLVAVLPQRVPDIRHDTASLAAMAAYTMQKAIRNRAIGLNYMAWMMGIFGVIALALSAIGVYGVMAYMVSEQTHETGIRMALGAPRQNVLGMVFRRGMTTIAIGLAVGLPLAFGFSRLVSSLIFGVNGTDAPSFVGIPMALVAAAAPAIYIPARRAMRIDPIVALRYE